MVFGVDFTSGRVLWQREAHRGAPPHPRHLKNSYASETPTTDGERVYVLFGNIGVFAFTMDGTPVWQRKWPARATRNGWGTAASPVLHARAPLPARRQRRTVVARGARRPDGHGRVAGRACTRDELGHAVHLAPRSANRNRRLRDTRRGVLRPRRQTALDAAGHVEHRHPDALRERRAAVCRVGLCRRPGPPRLRDQARRERRHHVEHGRDEQRVCGVVAAAGGAVQPIADRATTGSTTRCSTAGSSPRTTRAREPRCTGRQRIDPAGVGFTASPWAANGRLYAISEDGDTYVIKAGPKYELLAKNSLGEMTMATPAMAQGNLIVRTAERLYRIGGK